MQQASQITEPDFAPLMDDMFFAQGSDIEASRFIAPRIEVELAFILGKPLQGPGRDAVRRALGHRVRDAGDRDHRRAHRAVRPRHQGHAQGRSTPSATSPPTPASCSAAGRCGPTEVDLRWVGALLYKNGVIEETGLAAGVLNHPATGVAWLANKIAPYDEQLNAGDVVLAGSFTRPTAAQAGDNFRDRLRAARLGRVPLRLTEGEVHD